MQKPRVRASFLLLTITAVSGALVAVACSDDTTTPPAAEPDGSSTTPETPDGGGSSGQLPPDGGEGEEIISDGGAEPPAEEDGGLTDPDGGFDAGPACQTLTVGPFVKTTCAATPVRVGTGGDLTTTTYQLTSVTVLGNKAVCAPGGGYEELEHRGTLQVTASSPTSATFEFIDQYKRSGPSRVGTRRYDVAVTASGNKLTYTPQTCATSPAPAEATYYTGTSAAKKTITLRLPWGASSEALYRYTEQ